MYQPTRTLTKVWSSTLATAITALLIWLLETYAHANIPVGVQGAILTIITFAVAWVTPILPGEIEKVPPADAIELTYDPISPSLPYPGPERRARVYDPDGGPR